MAELVTNMSFKILCNALGSPVGAAKVPRGAVNDRVSQIEHVLCLRPLEVHHNHLPIRYLEQDNCFKTT